MALWLCSYVALAMRLCRYVAKTFRVVLLERIRNANKVEAAIPLVLDEFLGRFAFPKKQNFNVDLDALD